MNGQPQQALRQLIVEHGMSLCDDPRRLKALLLDHCGDYPREINVLVAALEERVPQDLQASRSGPHTGVLLGQLTRRLQDKRALEKEAARWAVGSWATALGMIVPAGPPAEPPPPVTPPPPVPPPPPPTKLSLRLPLVFFAFLLAGFTMFRLTEQPEPVVPRPLSRAERYAQHGLFLYDEGDYSGAVRELNQALRLEGNRAEWHYHLGVASSRAGDTEEAIRAYRQYLAMAPGGSFAAQAKDRLTQIEPRATIEKIWVDYDITQNAERGILIHVRFDINNLRGKPCEVIAFFHHDNASNTPVREWSVGRYSTTDGQLCVAEDINPGHQFTTYEDLDLFLPYSAMNPGKAGKWHLKFAVQIRRRDEGATVLTASEGETLQFTRG